MKKKIKFIEKKTDLNKDLSKLFNIVVNYYQLNAPKKVGFCTSIYENFFNKNEKGTFEEAVNYYYKEVTKLKNNTVIGSLFIKQMQEKTGRLSISLLKELDLLFEDGSNINKEINLFLEQKENGEITREEQYKKIIYKVLAIFKNHKNKKDTLESIYKWKEKIKEKYKDKEIKEKGEKYLFDLLTINSMHGILIQNDILKYFSTIYKNSVYGTNNKFEKMEIDGFINGKRASIKSINYKNSPYKRIAAKNIEEIIGGPIIYYKVINDYFIIENKKEILDFYNKAGTDIKVLKEIEEVKNKKF